MQRLTLPDDPELAQHAANAIAQHSRRGWRITKPTKCTHIDGIVALMMALDRLENQPKPSRCRMDQKSRRRGLTRPLLPGIFVAESDPGCVRSLFLRERGPRLARLVRHLWRRLLRVRTPEQPPKPARETNLATPPLLLTRHTVLLPVTPTQRPLQNAHNVPERYDSESL